MTLLGSLLALAFFVGLIIVGMLVNLYLYLSGVFRKPPFKHIRRFRSAIPEGVAEEQFTIGAPASDTLMGNYVRRFVLIGIGILIVLAIIIAFMLSALY
jgi:hypothetical protein